MQKMGWDYVDFVLLFEGERGKEVYSLKPAFWELLRKRKDKWNLKFWADNEVGVPEGEGPEFKGFAPFHVNEIVDNARNYSVLTFWSSIMKTDSRSLYSQTKLFFDIFFEACRVLRPVFGTANDTWEKKRPLWDEAEFHHDPYIFCFEPPLFEYRTFNPVQYLDFLHDKNLPIKIMEIRKAMSRSELVKVMKENSNRVADFADIGVGVWKGGGGVVKGRSIALNPRYDIRQELRRRGVQIEDGEVERYERTERSH